MFAMSDSSNGSTTPTGRGPVLLLTAGTPRNLRSQAQSLVDSSDKLSPRAREKHIWNAMFEHARVFVFSWDMRH